MKKVSVGLLRPNPISFSLYGDLNHDENFLSLKTSIQLEGVLEPLVVSNDFYIISGVRRFFASKQLGLQEIPVVFSPISQEQVDEYMVISHQQQRVKSSVQIFREIEIITKTFDLKQGRNSNDPLVIQGRKERGELIKLTSTSTIERLKDSKKMLSNLYKGDEQQVWKELYKMDNEGKSVLSIQKEVRKRLTQSTLTKETKTVKELVTENLYKIFQANAMNLSFLEDGLVDLVFTSPPYYCLRDYETGEIQLGNEKTVEEFIENLVKVFMECSRVMKPTASMFINIMDSYKDGALLNVPGKLKQALMDKGLMLVSEIVWAKENPLYIKGKRPQPCYEVIYHFVKTLDYKYYTDWMSDVEFEGKVTYGDFGKSRQLKNFFDYRNQIVQTSSANNVKLANVMKKMGHPMDHSATMPFEIPNIGILSTTQVGDTVLDPFNGLATTGLAAISQDRYYIGVDNNPRYIDQSKVRLNLFEEGHTKLQSEGQIIYQAA
uniref:DNA methyltransferase n=1 Tax=Algoriphagus sp. TaxID=1872435 RepID=UPI004048C2FB